MTLPQGQFQCWQANGWIYLSREDAPRSAYGGPNDSKLPEELFLHIFGVAPKPGEALRLDATRYGAHCPTCHAMLDHADSCPSCHGWPEPPFDYHARIISRKTLGG